MQQPLFDFLADLGDAQATQYLLAHSVNAGRMNYMARTTPASMCREAANDFDKAVLQTAAVALKQKWSTHEAQQSSFSTRDGGLGLRPVADILDAAYIGSRAATHELCASIRPAHTWDADALGSPLREVFVQVRHVAGLPLCSDDDKKLFTQRRLSRSLETARLKVWDAGVPAASRARRLAYADQRRGETVRLHTFQDT